MPKLRRRASSVVIAIVALTAAACSGGEAAATSRPAANERGGAGPAVLVTVARVEQKPMPLELDVIGTTEPYATVAVHAQLTGLLTSVTFTQGDDVRAGQPLFMLDRRPLEAALNQAEASLARDVAQSSNARAQAERYADLAQRGIATREQVDQMTTNAAALGATVDADRAAVENARVQLQYATITAPISGRTGVLMVQAGNLVRANDTTPLVVINQVTPILVSFAIPEAQLPAFKRYFAAGTVHVAAKPPTDSEAPSTGRVTFIDNAVDPTTGTIKLKSTLPNADRRLWPGQFLDVAVTLTTDPQAIVVPSAAVQTGPQGQYVYVVKPDQTVELRPVTPLRTSGAQTVITTGVQPGETVVTDGQIRLVSGARIAVKSGDAKMAS